MYLSEYASRYKDNTDIQNAIQKSNIGYSSSELVAG